MHQTFYEEPAFHVRKSSSVGEVGDVKTPRIIVDDLEGYLDLALFKLVKDNYGSIIEILDTPVFYVAKALSHSGFIADYESEFFRLNNPKEK